MAGGKGTRVAAVDATLPKPLLPVAGRPILDHQLAVLKRQGLTSATLVVGHLGGAIQARYGGGAGFGVRLEYIVEDEPLGTAGALALLPLDGADTLLINGDLVFDIDLARFARAHRAGGAAATIVTHPNDHPSDSAIVVTDESGQVTRWVPKDADRGWLPNRVNAGIHLLAPGLVSATGRAERRDLDRDVLAPLVGRSLRAYQTSEYVKDAGTPARLEEISADLESGLVPRRNLTVPQEAVFFDRDGTINRPNGFITAPDQFELRDGAATMVRAVNRSGALAIVVTNQPVIARGEADWADLDAIHAKMDTLLGREGAYVDAVYVCPHHPDAGFPGERPEYKRECDCRKPKPGLIWRAAQDFNIDLTRSLLVGDSWRDEDAAKAAGLRFQSVEAAR
jgi:D-glycero-D-manno-heptose 1,7-bisphosphate phosphatase